MKKNKIKPPLIIGLFLIGVFLYSYILLYGCLNNIKTLIDYSLQKNFFIIDMKNPLISLGLVIIFSSIMTYYIFYRFILSLLDMMKKFSSISFNLILNPGFLIFSLYPQFFVEDFHTIKNFPPIFFSISIIIYNQIIETVH